MKLCLFRHGQAESLERGISDAERQLTEKGRDTVRCAAEGLKAYVGTEPSLFLWSSPLVRAVQTAEIIADALHIKPIKKVAAIGTGNLDEVLKLLGRLPENSCVILVGHEPYLGLWSRQLCNVNLTFKKGAAAGVEWTNPEGELLWFAQPSVFKQMGKR